MKDKSIAIDGSKFQAVSSADMLREHEALNATWNSSTSDEQDEVVIDYPVVASALEGYAQRPGAGSSSHAHHARFEFQPTTCKRPSMPNTR